ARCVSRYHRGTVTGIPSRHTVEIDGIPRHVRELRHRAEPEESREQAQPEDDSDDELVLHFAQPKVQSMPKEEEPLTTCPIGEFEALPARLKRSSRVREARTCACCDT
ncbi:hypothetical protein TTRE_0000984701, partial [Trichuris trichiura]